MMSKLIFKNNDLLTAVKKAQVAEKDAYEIRVTDRIEPKSGKHFLSLCACNGSVQSIITVLATVDGLSGDTRIVLPASFSGMVTTLSAFSDRDISLNIREGNCLMSCGGGSVDVPLLESAIAIAPADPTTEKPAKATLEAAALKKAVSIGSGAMTSESGRVEAVRNAVDLSLVTYEGKPAVRIISVSGIGSMAAGATAPVKASVGTEELLDKRSYTLNSAFCKIVSGLGDGDIEFMLFSKQVIIRQGTDFYIVVPNAAPFPSTICAALYQVPEMEYRATVSQKAICRAIDVALLGNTSEAERKIALSISNRKLSISSVSRENKADVDAEAVEGEIRIGMSGDFLKKSLSGLGSVVTLAGTNAVSLMFFQTDEPGVAAFVAPCKLDDEEQEEGSAKEE